jgi:hypothetical protein
MNHSNEDVVCLYKNTEYSQVISLPDTYTASNLCFRVVMLCTRSVSISKHVVHCLAKTRTWEAKKLAVLFSTVEQAEPRHIVVPTSKKCGKKRSFSQN